MTDTDTDTDRLARVVDVDDVTFAWTVDGELATGTLNQYARHIVLADVHGVTISPTVAVPTVDGPVVATPRVHRGDFDPYTSMATLAVFVDVYGGTLVGVAAIDGRA